MTTKEIIQRAWIFKGTVRRYFLVRFKKRYVEEQLKRRRGKCLQCGKCCEMSFKCPLLDKSGNQLSCRIYKKGRPLSCRLFPIDERDIEDVGGRCGYYFQY
ncbi:MAG: hypothetical protein D6734_01210 [Candidatus Schekmanbacteria bacterium]|nr:MAG: hypothetical protein D6734_01210 [Candidatus Schekmanbacteria bacterium]